jgi:hypothetical protein
MLTAPSLQNEFSLVFSGDPALDLPADETERNEALKVARETGQWPLLAGQEPTLFKCRPLSGAPATWLIGESRRRQLSQQELFELAFRLALTGVTNLGSLKVKRVPRDEQLMIDDHTLAAIYAIGDGRIGTQVVIEIGAEVLGRAMEVIAPRA